MKYLSGFQALNIPNENGLIADWHPLLYLNPNKLVMYESADSPLQERDIRKCFVPILQEYYNVASFARSIADLVYFGKASELRGCVNDFLDSADEIKLFYFLKDLPQTAMVNNFLKYELTKLYFSERNNVRYIRKIELNL